MIVYVVYWVDLDNDCLKKSVVDILGVFNNETDAKQLSDDYYHEGYSEDERCYYTSVYSFELNKISGDIRDYLKENDKRFIYGQPKGE